MLRILVMCRRILPGVALLATGLAALPPSDGLAAPVTVAIKPSEAAALLYPVGVRDAPLGPEARRALAACTAGNAEERTRCLLRGRYGKDPAAARSAVSIFDRAGTVAGLEPPRRMQGGWRGNLNLVPVLPVGRWRAHLAWIAQAMDDFHRFFTSLESRAQRSGRVVRYRWRALALRFFQSVGKRTPSAYADGWTVAWNVNGSLLTSADGARETLFHEIFHLNDAHHQDWTAKALGVQHRAIVARCTRGRGKRTWLHNACLAPYAPHRTKVQGQIYYAFHPESGVGEYGAELAVRYFMEQRAALAGKPPGAPFKCLTPENLKALDALAQEFFGGVDLLGACVPRPDR